MLGLKIASKKCIGGGRMGGKLYKKKEWPYIDNC